MGLSSFILTCVILSQLHVTAAYKTRFRCKNMSFIAMEDVVLSVVSDLKKEFTEYLNYQAVLVTGSLVSFDCLMGNNILVGAP